MNIIQVDPILQNDLAGARQPYDKKYERGSAFVFGQYCAREEAVIPLADMGFIQSDAVYEVMAVPKGRFFRMQDHFHRLATSCEKFRLRNPYNDEQITRIFNRLVALTGLRNASIFWCVTRGMPKAGANAVRDRNNPDVFENRFYAFAYPYASIITQEQRERGMDIMISKKHIRIHPQAVDPTAKNFHWMDMKLALFEARDQGMEWAVLTDIEGYLTEAAGANIFLVKDGELHTPDTGCLEGITRRTVFELAESIGVRVHSRKAHANELLQGDEAFMSTTAGGIMPVNSVNGVVLGGTPGPGALTTRLHNLYWEKLWEGWKCAPVNYELTDEGA